MNRPSQTPSSSFRLRLFSALISCFGYCMATPSTNTPYIIHPRSTHTASLIFLHGLGDSGRGWAQEFKNTIGAKFPFLKVILPNAPEIKVTLNFGMKMPAWYNITTLDESDPREDIQGMQQSAQLVWKIVEQEITENGIRPERIFVGGFSQGGVVALLAGLITIPERLLALKGEFVNGGDPRAMQFLGGIVSFSCYAPHRTTLAKLISETHKTDSSMPAVFWAHGLSDNLVHYRWGKGSVDLLKSMGVQVEFKSYQGMGHHSCPEEMEDLIGWMKGKLSESTDDHHRSHL